MKLVRVILSIVSLAALNVFYFSNILFSNQVFSFRDLSRYYYPLRLFAFNEIKEGRFPFWNPYINCGHPLFAALQSVVLYPFSAIYLLFNFDFAFNLFIVLHIFLGGVFFYLLMRDLAFRHISALISGIVFMFSGYLIAVINLTTTLAAAIWFPLVFLFFNRALNQRRYSGNLILAGIFLGFMFLGGEPTPMFATLMILGLYSMMHVFVKRGQILKTAGIFIALVTIFILLFSFQIFPFIEFIRLSSRTQTDFEMASHWSFPPQDIINFIMPFFYGTLQFQEQTPLRQDWLLFSYLGIVSLILFLFAFIFRKDKYSLFFRFVFIIGLIFIYGRFTPIYHLIYKIIPGFNFIRYPIKFFFINSVAFSFLVGCGWQEYADRIKAQDKRFIGFIKGLFVLAFIAAFIFLLIYQFKDKIFVLINDYLKSVDETHRGKYSIIFFVNLFNFRRLLVFFILGVLFLFLGAREKIKLGLAGFLTLMLIIIDLSGGRNLELNPTVGREVLRKQTKNIVFLKEDKTLFRVYTSKKMNKENEVLRGDVYEQAFENSIDHLCPNRLMEFKIYDARGYESVHNENFSKLSALPDTAPFPSSTNILNMLNVKYILTPEEIRDSTCKLKVKGSSSYLYENLNCLSRAYIVPEVLIIKDELEIANKLKDKNFLPQKQVILEEEPKAVLSQDKEVAGKESIQIVTYKPSEVIIEAVILNKPKVLVLADIYYPGWEAHVNGKKTTIYKANFCLRAVYLAPGKHRVRFSYNPLSFKIGLSISLATLVVLLITLFVIKYKNE
jgi:hypothetical protein